MDIKIEKQNTMKTPSLIAAIIGFHVLAVGSVIFIQGCGRTRAPQTAPPASVMPPPAQVDEVRPVTPPRPLPPSVQPDETRPSVIPPDLKSYTVQRGDSLSAIAHRHGVTTAELADLNQIADRNTIRIGQKLLLPAHARVSATPTPAPTPPPAVTAAEGDTYTVQAGDSLSRIAQRHGISASELAKANNISDPNRIRVGQALIIPGASKPTPSEVEPEATPAPTPAVVEEAVEPIPEPEMPEPERPEATDAFPYTVRTGDTLETIARDFAVLKEDIVKLNNLSADAAVVPGQALLIPPMQ